MLLYVKEKSGVFNLRIKESIQRNTIIQVYVTYVILNIAIAYKKNVGE